MTAILYGVGVGPGHPDLITVRARDILQAVPVIAYPAPVNAASLVRTIADPHIPAGRTEIAMEIPMVQERFPAAEVYDHYAGVIGSHLDAGRNVALLCEGDPFLYGSYMYLHERLATDYEIVVIPGVSSLGAVAAVAGIPLVSRDEMLSVIPATLDENILETRFGMADAVAIVKIGRNLQKVRRVIAKLGGEKHAWYVERATMREERVMPLEHLHETNAPYFSMILLRNPPQQRISPSKHAGLPKSVALVSLTARGAELARRLRAHLPASQVHGLQDRINGPDVPFASTTRHLQDLFLAGTPIAAICASGIVVRALAPCLNTKGTEPPVISISEDGRFVIPILGGNHGANRLATHIAQCSGGFAAVTTAGDRSLGLALDEPPAGWILADDSQFRDSVASLLAGGAARLDIEVGEAEWLRASAIRFSDDGDVRIRVTDKRASPGSGDLIYHPPVLALGVGCERGTDTAQVLELAKTTLDENGLSPSSVACVVSLDLKMDETAVLELADSLGVPARFFTAEELNAETPRLANPSDRVFAEVGCYGVAEGAALKAVGNAGDLIVAKTRSRQATVAVARKPAGIDPQAIGKPRGRLRVVGIGPGRANWRTPECTNALCLADTVIGYGLYLDLLGSMLDGKTVHASPLGEEENRARLALDLAGEGREVALVSSGDAGIYALATLVFDLLAKEDCARWNRIAIDVVPGISALQAAAARAGAPLGHDFCAISLSDLLTPWPVIEQRLRAAANGDFVISLFNPASDRRRQQLPAAQEILLAARSPETPVLLSRNLGRPAEAQQFTTLTALDVNDVDMLTLVIIGNSQSKIVHTGGKAWMFTPRGYLEPGDPRVAAEAASGIAE